MKFLLKILVLLSLLVSWENTFSQSGLQAPASAGGWTSPNNSYGTIQKGSTVWGSLGFPTGCGAPSTLFQYDLKTFRMYGDSCSGTVYFYNPSTQTWFSGVSIGGGLANLYIDPVFGGGVYNGSMDKILLPPDSSKHNGAYATWWDISQLGLGTTTDTLSLANTDYTIDSIANNEPGTPSAGHNVLVWDSATGSFALQGNNIAEYDGTSYSFVHPADGATARTLYANPPLNEKYETVRYDSAHNVWSSLGYAALQNGNYQNADLNLGTRPNYALTFRTNLITRDSIAANGDEYKLNLKDSATAHPDNFLKIEAGTGKQVLDSFKTLNGVIANSDTALFNDAGYADLGTISGGGGTTDTSHLSARINLKVDSVTTNADSSQLSYWVNGVEHPFYNVPIDSGSVSTYTLDSTGQPAGKVPFTGTDRKYHTTNYFLYDSVNRKLVIGNTNVSVGGPSTKFFVTGIMRSTGNSIASGFKTPTGISSQFLKADGSVDANSYINQTALDDSAASIRADFPTSGTGGLTHHYQATATSNGQVSFTFSGASIPSSANNVEVFLSSGLYTNYTWVDATHLTIGATDIVTGETVDIYY